MNKTPSTATPAQAGRRPAGGPPLWLRVACVLALFCTAPAVRAQELLSRWVATVDEATQQIVLRWSHTTDTSAMGYHICTGDPCLDYAIVDGVMDTTYICLDHSSLERHTYRLHVYDSARNALGALTPFFGNMVLTAEVPECETAINTSWTPYEGMPGGVAAYSLMVRLLPYSTEFEQFHIVEPGGTLAYDFEVATGVTHVEIKVLAVGNDGSLVSQSNIVSVERRTVDTAERNEITAVVFDTTTSSVRVSMLVDTAFTHTLWRSIDGSPWRKLADIHSPTPETVYIDTNINRYDSVHCYQLSVADACGMNERYSATRFVVVPDPPPPLVFFPNIIIAGDDANGAFRPVTSGLMGDLYELYIYDRNGMLVFRTDDPSAAWRPDSGTPQCAYVYTLRLRFANNMIRTYTGTVTVIH